MGNDSQTDRFAPKRRPRSVPLTADEEARLRAEIIAMRDERREQFEMLEAFTRLSAPDSILGPAPVSKDVASELLPLFARWLAIEEAR